MLQQIKEITDGEEMKNQNFNAQEKGAYDMKMKDTGAKIRGLNNGKGKHYLVAKS